MEIKKNSTKLTNNKASNFIELEHIQGKRDGENLRYDHEGLGTLQR